MALFRLALENTAEPYKAVDRGWYDMCNFYSMNDSLFIHYSAVEFGVAQCF